MIAKAMGRLLLEKLFRGCFPILTRAFAAGAALLACELDFTHARPQGDTAVANSDKATLSTTPSRIKQNHKRLAQVAGADKQDDRSPTAASPTGNTIYGQGAGISLLPPSIPTNGLPTSIRYGTNNSFFGQAAGRETANGWGNVFVGDNAGAGNLDGGFNTFIGSYAGWQNGSGGSNVYVGRGAGTHIVDGAYNFFAGHAAGYNYVSGASNVFLGDCAGCNKDTGVHNLSGDHEIFIGNSLGPADSKQLSNAIILGNEGFIAASNAMMLGSSGKYQLNVGVNTPNPAIYIPAGYGLAVGSSEPRNTLTIYGSQTGTDGSFADLNFFNNGQRMAAIQGVRTVSDDTSALTFYVSSKGTITNQLVLTGDTVTLGSAARPTCIQVYSTSGRPVRLTFDDTGEMKGRLGSCP
jgi:hypothetical protein